MKNLKKLASVGMISVLMLGMVACRKYYSNFNIQKINLGKKMCYNYIYRI